MVQVHVLRYQNLTYKMYAMIGNTGSSINLFFFCPGELYSLWMFAISFSTHPSHPCARSFTYYIIHVINFISVWHSKHYMYAFLCPVTKYMYSVTHVRNSEIKQLLTLYCEITWYLVCGYIVISYRSSLRFIPVQWFLAELWPLVFEICPNICLHLNDFFFRYAWRYWLDFWYVSV